MPVPWIKLMPALVVTGLLSGPALAEGLSNDEMQSIQQYCDEMNGFGAYASEEERQQAVSLCVDDEVSRATAGYQNPEETDSPDRIE